MSPADVKDLANAEILELLVRLHPNGQATNWLAALISDPVAVEGVRELSRRYAPDAGFPISPAGRMAGASTVFVDRDRWRSFLFKNRLHASSVGSLMEPERSSGWGHMVTHRGRAGFWAIDSLATALNMNTSDLVWEIGTDAERDRLLAYV